MKFGTIFIRDLFEYLSGDSMEDTESKIRMVLEQFWDDRAISNGSEGETIVEALIAPVESMVAVEVLVELDDIIGFKIPMTVIRAGGYDTKEQFINLLTSKVLIYFASQPS